MPGNSALPKGSIVLVTGVNGYVGSHVADQLLAHGYGIRGTARDEVKLNAAIDLLRSRHAGSQIEGVVVKEMNEEGAYEKAMPGVAAVAHVASDVSFSDDPNIVIGTAVGGVAYILKAAANSPLVKRVVMTSSSLAVHIPKPNESSIVTANTWNESDPKAVMDPNADRSDPSWPGTVYAASKVASERTGWEFIKDNKPQFVFNVVNPNIVLGPVLLGSGSSCSWVEDFYEGKTDGTFLQALGPLHAVHVRDVALLHVAALLEADVQNERILGFGEAITFGDVLRVLKSICPSKSIQSPAPKPEERDLSTVDTKRGIELLRRYGRPGFASLEDTLKDQLISRA